MQSLGSTFLSGLQVNNAESVQRDCRGVRRCQQRLWFKPGWALYRIQGPGHITGVIWYIHFTKFNVSPILPVILDTDGNQTIFFCALLDADFGQVG